MSTETLHRPLGTTADLLSENLSAKAAFNKDSKIGDTVTGTVLSFEVRQTRDYDTNELETWDDGSPCRQIVVNVQTDIFEDEDDNGERSIYVKWWGTSRRAFLRAIKEAGAKDLEEGGTLTASYIGDGEQANKRLAAPKLYSFEYRRPGVVAQAEAAPAKK